MTDKPTVQEPTVQLPPELLNAPIKSPEVLYVSAVSGLMYSDPEAAGDISHIVIKGKRWKLAVAPSSELAIELLDMVKRLAERKTPSIAAYIVSTDGWGEAPLSFSSVHSADVPLVRLTDYYAVMDEARALVKRIEEGV